MIKQNRLTRLYKNVFVSPVFSKTHGVKMNNPLFYTIISALGFGLWPFVTRFSGLSSIMISLTLTTGTMIVVGTGAILSQSGVPSVRMISIGILAGLMNGISTITFGILIGSKQWELSTYLPMVSGMMILLTMLCGVILFGETMTTSKALGGIALLIGIYLLR